MAVTDTSALVVPGHFSPARFDALLARHGSPIELRFATRCGCWDDRAGRPDPGCMVCFPFGFVWDAPLLWNGQPMKAYGPNRKPTRRHDAVGTYEVGDAFFTLPSGIEPPFMSRITASLSVLTVFDELVKAKQDMIRYPDVLNVDRVWYSTRTPATGAPYDRANVPLSFSGANPDLTITGRQVTWNPASTVPDGTRYIVRFQTYLHYVVWEQQERNEGGNILPSRFLCKKIDYLLHPRGTKEASY